MKRRLTIENLANAALVIVCLWTAQVLYTLPSRSQAVAEPPSFHPGETVAVRNLDLSRADKTVLLFLRSTCKFCTQSMPFYSRLIDEIRASKKAASIRVVVVTSDDRETATKYLAMHSVSVDEILPDASAIPKVTGTPTIILTARGGAVERTWLGRLDASREGELRQALGL